MVNSSQIRRELAKKRGTLFFSPAERALLAVLQLKPYDDLISAAYTNGAHNQYLIIMDAIEAAWEGEAAA